MKTLTAQGRTVYLKTPLLEIYSDILGVKFVKADSPMRTQDRNERQTQETFVRGLSGVPGKRMFYDNSHMQRGSLFDAVAGQFSVGPSWLDLLHFQLPDLKLPAGRPVELIHPTTEREKWHNTAAARSINILIKPRGYCPHAIFISSVLLICSLALNGSPIWSRMRTFICIMAS
ncbi:TPA: hypothetical protein ACOVJJ_004444 [Klebsiella oxytoca]